MDIQEAIRGCKKNDHISQRKLFDAYADGMLIICLRYVKDPSDAEEIMLDGFYKFYKTIGRFIYSSPNGVGGWLKKIMINECLMFLRKRNEITITQDLIAAEVEVEPELSKMNAKDIFRLITALPTGYRTVFNLFSIEGYSHKEIAHMLEITEGTSKSQLNRARTLLQNAIKEMRILL